MTPEEKALRQEWGTPAYVFDWLDSLFHFGIDVCATHENTKVPELYLSKGDKNGLNTSWGLAGNVFGNPGFADLEPWLKKASWEARHNMLTSLIISHAVHTPDWYKKYKPLADRIWAPDERIDFIPAPGIITSSNSRDVFFWIFTPWGHLSETEITSVHILGKPKKGAKR